MPKPAPIPIALAAAAACAACAPVEQDEAFALPANVSAERQCFSVDRISGYSEAPDGPRGADRLYVRSGVNDRWLLETFGGCHDLDWALQVGLDTRLQTNLCTGEVATLVVPRTGFTTPDRCTARVLGKVIES